MTLFSNISRSKRGALCSLFLIAPALAGESSLDPTPVELNDTTHMDSVNWISQRDEETNENLITGAKDPISSATLAALTSPDIATIEIETISPAPSVHLELSPRRADESSNTSSTDFISHGTTTSFEWFQFETSSSQKKSITTSPSSSEPTTTGWFGDSSTSTSADTMPTTSSTNFWIWQSKTTSQVSPGTESTPTTVSTESEFTPSAESPIQSSIGAVSHQGERSTDAMGGSKTESTASESTASESTASESTSSESTPSDESTTHSFFASATFHSQSNTDTTSAAATVTGASGSTSSDELVSQSSNGKLSYQTTWLDSQQASTALHISWPNGHSSSAKFPTSSTIDPIASTVSTSLDTASETTTSLTNSLAPSQIALTTSTSTGNTSTHPGVIASVATPSTTDHTSTSYGSADTTASSSSAQFLASSDSPDSANASTLTTASSASSFSTLESAASEPSSAIVSSDSTSLSSRLDAPLTTMVSTSTAAAIPSPTSTIALSSYSAVIANSAARSMASYLSLSAAKGSDAIITAPDGVVPSTSSLSTPTPNLSPSAESSSTSALINHEPTTSSFVTSTESISAGSLSLDSSKPSSSSSESTTSATSTAEPIGATRRPVSSTSQSSASPDVTHFSHSLETPSSSAPISDSKEPLTTSASDVLTGTTTASLKSTSAQLSSLMNPMSAAPTRSSFAKSKTPIRPSSFPTQTVPSEMSSQPLIASSAPADKSSFSVASESTCLTCVDHTRSTIPSSTASVSGHYVAPIPSEKSHSDFTSNSIMTRTEYTQQNPVSTAVNPSGEHFGTSSSVAVTTEKVPISNTSSPTPSTPRSYSQNPSQFLPTQLMTATTVTSSIGSVTSDSSTSGSRPTSSSPALPNAIMPQQQPKPDKSQKLVQIGFKYPLNYPFVAENSDSAAQIFQYLPEGLSQGLNIDQGSIRMLQLVPHQTSGRDSFLQTIAQFFVPKSSTKKLDNLIQTPNSALYKDQSDPSVQTLMSLIDTNVPLTSVYTDSGSEGSDSGSDGSGGDGSSGGRSNNGGNTGNNAGAQGSLDQNAQVYMKQGKTSAKVAGITIGTVVGAGLLGGFLFLASMVARSMLRKSRIGSEDMPSAQDVESYHDDFSSMNRFSHLSMGIPSQSNRATRPLTTEIPTAANDVASGVASTSGPAQSSQVAISHPVITESSLGWQ